MNEMQHSQALRDFPNDDEADVGALLALKCPHYSSYNAEYGGFESMLGF